MSPVPRGPEFPLGWVRGMVSTGKRPDRVSAGWRTGQDPCCRKRTAVTTEQRPKCILGSRLPEQGNLLQPIHSFIHSTISRPQVPRRAGGRWRQSCDCKGAVLPRQPTPQSRQERERNFRGWSGKDPQRGHLSWNPDDKEHLQLQAGRALGTPRRPQGEPGQPMF